MYLFGFRICSIAIVVCHGFKTKICTRLLFISNLLIQYPDFAIPRVIQKLGYKFFLCFICSYKKQQKNIHFLCIFRPSGFCGIRIHSLDVEELQLAFGKAYYNTELCGPINVIKD